MRGAATYQGYHRIVTDDDGHHFVIPSNREIEWERWLELGCETGDYPPLPGWAYSIGGNLSQIEFENWKHE